MHQLRFVVSLGQPPETYGGGAWVSTLLFNEGETGSICILFEPMRLKLFSYQPQEGSFKYFLKNTRVKLFGVLEQEGHFKYTYFFFRGWMGECASVSQIPLIFWKKTENLARDY